MHSLSVSKTLHAQCLVCSVETPQMSRTALQFRRGSLSVSQCTKLGHLGLSEAVWKISTRRLRASRT